MYSAAGSNSFGPEKVTIFVVHVLIRALPRNTSPRIDLERTCSSIVRTRGTLCDCGLLQATVRAFTTRPMSFTTTFKSATNGVLAAQCNHSAISTKRILRNDSPEYSGKQLVSGERLIFSSKRSFLLRKRMMDVSTNHLLLQIESNRRIDSIMRFCRASVLF